jgi:histidinol-phosphate aminotransferase
VAIGRTGLRGLVRKRFDSLRPYDSPEPLEEFAARKGFPVEFVAKLDQNENPYGPSPRVLTALAGGDRYHIYPDPAQRAMRARLEEYTGVSRDRIVVGNGSDELIELLFRLVLEPGDDVLTATPTFSYYKTVVAVCGGRHVGIDRRDDFGVAVDDMVRAIGERTRAVILASPNNPTGTTTSLSDIERIARAAPLVIVDEAYFEFSGTTALPLAERLDNVIILRTFSKWAGLAGLRIGYGILPEDLIPDFNKVKPPYSLGVAASTAMAASLDDVEFLRGVVSKIVEERDRLFLAIEGTGFLTPVPSSANFILCRVNRGRAMDIRQQLEDRGILVRYYDDGRLRDYLRISVGRPEHTDRLIVAFREIGAEMTD